MELESRNRSFSAQHGKTYADDGSIGHLMSRIANGLIDTIAPVPWTAHAGCHHRRAKRSHDAPRERLYTPEQRRKRDETPWTFVQGVLAPLQFLVFMISTILVVRFLATGEGYVLATASVIAKTAILYTIMVTGSVWEKVVFDKWLFAPAFFWEDVFSMVVLALHTVYLAAVLFNLGTAEQQLMIALAAYVTYVINAGQFLLKLRAARLEGAS